jgi:hypothetical protein
MTDNSDYKKPRTNLVELLPDTFRTDVNNSFLENGPNRYLTKSELTPTFGTIGKKSTRYSKSTRIPEPSVQRQAYQLQPLLNSTIATVNYLSSYADILTKASDLGVDPERLPLWGNTTQFNFAPPVDFDKLVNWGKYYWYDPAGSAPQYITIKNTCASAVARVNVLTSSIASYIAGGPAPGVSQSEFDTTVAQMQSELSRLQIIRDCACYNGRVGWDMTQWDDNSLNWWHINEFTAEPPTGPINTAPSSPPLYSLWFDTDAKQFKRWMGSSWVSYDNISELTVGSTVYTFNPFFWYDINDVDKINDSDPIGTPPRPKLRAWDGEKWVLFAPSDLSSGIFPWDSVESSLCVTQTDDWSAQNKWYHQADVPNISLAIRATMPIIEYNPNIELNQWSYTKYKWSYRGSYLQDWISVDSEPTLYEMGIKFKVLGISTSTISNPGTITVDGDHRSMLQPGNKIHVNEVPSSVFTLTIYQADTTHGPGSDGYDPETNTTKFLVVEDTAQVILGLTTDTTVDFVLTTTSLGDTWVSFFSQWALTETPTPVPVNLQTRPTVIPQLSFGPLPTAGYNTFVLPDLFLVGRDTIRVYVDGKRQYGTYIEGWSTNIPGEYISGNFTGANDPSYSNIAETAVVSSTGHSYPGTHGNTIQFFDPVSQFSNVSIETIPAALSDQYLSEIEVRTSTDANFYTTNFSSIFTTLIKYRLVEQIKTEQTQYPLFDIFNVDGTTTYTANNIFGFQEGSTYSVDPRVGRRIAVTNNGKEFGFEQQLLNTDTGAITCYKDSWAIETSNPAGLQSIWRRGIPESDSQYVPKQRNEYQLAYGDSYVDSNGVKRIAGIDTPLGPTDWEIPSQMMFNIHHENRKVVLFSEIYTHFTSIINAQTPPVEFSSATSDFYRLLNIPNFGVGGTIKEFNDSYDTFLSAMFQTSTNPRAIIDFARSRYDYNLTLLQEYFLQNAILLLTNMSDPFYQDINKAISDYVITLFEQNEFLDNSFGDSTTHNTLTGLGIKNWITTLPYLKLSRPVVPAILFDVDLGIKQVLHHDGHISNISVPSSTSKSIYTKLLQSTNGVQGPITTRPVWPTVQKGQYWMDTGGVLYRFNVISTSGGAPSIFNPVGTYWLDGTSGLLYVRTNSVPLGWEIVKDKNGHITPGYIEPAWKPIVLEEIIANVIYQAELKLYEAVPDFDSTVFDFSTLLSSTSEQDVFVTYLKEQYFDYIQQTNSNPSVNNFDISNPFTWNYNSISPSYIPAVKVGSPTIWDASYQGIYEKNFGTQYPHLLPWKLQGYYNKPTWWDSQYKDTSGLRRWTNSMWNNIKNGIIPVGALLPDNITVGTGLVESPTQAPVYNFMCVDTSTDTLLAPYVQGNTNTFLNSVSIINQYIPSFSDPFSFGQQGVTEYTWRNSSYFLYGLLHIAFRMQPVRFLHDVFGPTFINVAGLQIDNRTKKVYSHKDAIFHGDLNSADQNIVLNGLNQWYVNFIRFNNLDINTSDFKEKWINWNANLTYQTGSFINSKSLDVAADYFSIIPQDYQVLIKKTPDMKNFWVDALLVTTESVGTDWTLNHNNKVPKYYGSDWVFRLSTPSPIGHTINYYGIKSYPCSFNTINDVGSTIGAIVLPWANVAGTPIPGEDILYVQDDTLTWFTGSPVQVTSAELYPTPLAPNTTYYIIKVADNQFKLASSYNNAVNGISIDITSPGSAVYIEELVGTFVALDGTQTSNIWKHIALDKRTTNTSLVPMYVTGVQSVINLIDGYSNWLMDQGWAFNEPEAVEVDIQTGKILNWQTEIERLIGRIYSGLGLVTIQGNPTSPGSISVLGNLIQGVGYSSGKYINIQTETITGTGSGATVNIVVQDNKVFSVNINKIGMQYNTGDTISVLGANFGGGDDIILTVLNVFPVSLNQPISGEVLHEVNPFRNNIWFKTPRGIISNIYSQSYSDVRVDSTVYDQFGDTLPSSSVFIFREDTKSRIRECFLCGSVYSQSGAVNSNQDAAINPYTTPHLGGAHLFLDGYEHAIVFNDYTTDGFLIFDPFIGLSTSKFTLAFEKGAAYTFRPNIGGYFLNGEQTVQNIENTVDNMQLYYDTFKVNETADFLDYARAALGYESPDYLDNIGINSKSKFIFWRGMIHNKGSINAVKAFINARLFVDAKIDDFWAYKVGEFGNLTRKYFNDINIEPEDIKKNELRLEFASSNIDPTFITITPTDDVRWEYFPDQRSTINPTLDFYFSAGVIGVITGTCNGSPVDVILPNNDGYQVVKFDPVTKISSVLVSGVSQLNNNHITITSSDNFNYSVYVFSVSKQKHNPAKLIDKQSKDVISSIMIWHPAVGFHYQVPISLIDIQRDNDPATYNNTISSGLTGTMYYQEEFVPRTNWNSQEVGKIWLRTSSFGYTPYYDPIVYPNVSDRITNWGKPTDWSSFDVLQWTESPVTPENWDAYVISQASNTELDQYSLPSGTPMKVIYRRVNINTDSTLPPTYSDYQRIDTNPRIQVLYDTISSVSVFPVQFLEQIDLRLDHNIDNGQVVNVYVNGILKTTTHTTSIISTILNEPPTNPMDKDSYKVGTIPTGDWTPFAIGDIVQWNETTSSWDVLTTGAEFDALSSVGAYVTFDPTTLNVGDTITFEYPLFNVDVSTLPNTMIEYTLFTPYTSVNTIDNQGNIVDTKYYFWVMNKNVRPTATTLSLSEIKSLLKVPSVPYMFMLGIDGTLQRFNSVVIRGISRFISQNDRFKVRFQTDASLRDDSDISSSLTKKNVHTQWELFRQEQNVVISRTLWNKLTESVVGYKLHDDNTPVPSLDRVLYDQLNGSATRIGMGEGQSFVDKDLALNTIINEIENPNYDLSPIDKSAFLDTYSFDTPENILTAMDYIYNTFAYSDTNRIFFSCLHDAMSLKSEYGDIFKTSAIALHGIKILETSKEAMNG